MWLRTQLRVTCTTQGENFTVLNVLFSVYNSHTFIVVRCEIHIKDVKYWYFHTDLPPPVLVLYLKNHSALDWPLIILPSILEQLEDYISEDDKAAYLAVLEGTEDWLYEEGMNCQKQVSRYVDMGSFTYYVSQELEGVSNCFKRYVNSPILGTTLSYPAWLYPINPVDTLFYRFEIIQLMTIELATVLYILYIWSLTFYFK